MTPKEKAIELVDKYVSLTDGWVYGVQSWNYKKQCALIAIDEIIKAAYWQSVKDYWQEVKQEIEKL